MVLPSMAQKKRPQNNPTYDNDVFNMGFSLGTNVMFFRLTPSSSMLLSNKCDTVYGVEPISQPGININMITDLRVLSFLNLRVLPGLNIGQRNLLYKKYDKKEHPDTLIFDNYTMRLLSTYMELPVLLKFSGLRINNYRPYLLAGGNIRFDREANRMNRKNEDYSIKLRALDYYYEVGGGIDFYMQYFKLGVELKMSYGVKDILIKEDYDYALVFDKIKNKMFMLSFHFE